MPVEQQDHIIESSMNLKEIAWVTDQIKKELKNFNKESFYETKWDKILYNLDTVKQYLWVLKEKKTWKELVTKNSSAMIMSVQIALYSLDYSFWNIDWILGDKTKEAIRKFQADNNLPVDANWRSLPSTIQKLVELIEKKWKIDVKEWEDWNVENDKVVNKKLEGLDIKVENKIINENKKVSQNIENKELLNQDVIRPEIQKLIDSLDINWDKFENVTYLTKTEAIAISTEKRCNFLNFSGIKEIDEEIFEKLLKHKWSIKIWIEKLTVWLVEKLVKNPKSITFSWLESIEDQKVYEELWKTQWTLRFDVLKSVTHEWMKELLNKPSWIYLDKIEEIDEEMAKSILEYSGDISLKWVKKISKEVAEIISTKNKWKIIMKWLEWPLSNDVLDELINIETRYLDLNHEVWSQISKYKKQKEREWKDLSETVLNVIDGKVPVTDLSKLTSITEDEIDILVKSTLYTLDLSGIKEIDEEMFWKLLKHKWSMNIWIEKLTVWLAEKLVENPKWITFSWLESIEDQKVYEELWKTQWTLRFDVLKSITDEWMRELVKKPWWIICLDKIEEIDEEMAKNMVEYPRDISLKWVKKISKEVAEILWQNNRWEINIEWVEAPLSEDILEEVMKAKHLKMNNEVWSQIIEYKKQKESEN